VLSSVPEVKLYYYTLSDNKVNVTIELVEKSERKRNSFVVEQEILEKLSYLSSYSLQVETKVQ